MMTTYTIYCLPVSKYSQDDIREDNLYDLSQEDDEILVYHDKNPFFLAEDFLQMLNDQDINPNAYFFAVTTSDGTMLENPCILEYKTTKLKNKSTLELYPVVDWLREEKGLFINMWSCVAGWSWTIEKCSTPENRGTHFMQHDGESGDDEASGLFTTYLKALQSAVYNALTVVEDKDYMERNQNCLKPLY